MPRVDPARCARPPAAVPPPHRLPARPPAFRQDCLLDFLLLMGDPDRHVRKAAVVALSAVVHHKPGLVAGGLEQLLPLLFDQTAIKPEMVRLSCAARARALR